MLLKTLHRGPDKNLTYLFGPQGSGPLACIDPGADVEPVVEAAGGRPIEMIICTHGHHDHTEGLKALKARTGAPVLAHRTLYPEFERLGIPLDVPLAGGDRFDVGGVPMRILYTPGHHPASISVLVADHWLFTGDTLFVGNCGRTDLPGSSPMSLWVSLQMIGGLGDDVIILPGHDYGSTPTSTIGREKAENATMQAGSLEEFEALP